MSAMHPRLNFKSCFANFLKFTRSFSILRISCNTAPLPNATHGRLKILLAFKISRHLNSTIFKILRYLKFRDVLKFHENPKFREYLKFHNL
ncbi:hypothetical protein [uncultured Campylobacter sp.]|uniref:hypothetical protein n=1 Tax=uncultured Campylobacter sp. TaxID=218934 RepID=UPI00262A7962|nr:hypothetical protein [uncultured Campylobacter sp.]